MEAWVAVANRLHAFEEAGVFLSSEAAGVSGAMATHPPWSPSQIFFTVQLDCVQVRLALTPPPLSS